MRRSRAFVGVVLISGVLGPVAAVAVPPDGPVENPLGGTVTLQRTTVAPREKVAFAGQGYEPAERVSIKLDDGRVSNAAGADVFAKIDAAGDGTFSGQVDLSTVGSASTAEMSSGTHNVRLLSSSPKGVRSIHVDFEVKAPGGGGGTGGGAPGGGTGGDGTGGGGPSGGGTGTPSTDDGATPAPGAARVISTRLAVKAGQVAVRLRGGTAAQRVTVSLVSRDRVRVRGRRRFVTLARPRSVSLAARATMTVSLSLTRDAKALLAGRRVLKARLGLAGTPTTVTLQR